MPGRETSGADGLGVGPHLHVEFERVVGIASFAVSAKADYAKVEVVGRNGTQASVMTTCLWIRKRARQIEAFLPSWRSEG